MRDGNVTAERRIVFMALGLSLIGALVGEHVSRRLVVRRVTSLVEGRQQLESQVRGMLASHQQLTGDLAKERQRTQELSAAVAEKNEQLDKAVARLAEEERAVRELHVRVATMQQRMDQLQGELAMTIQERKGPAKSAGASAVELQRIVVSSAETPAPQGHVLAVHRDWNFVVVDLGWDAVKIGDTISIFRDQALLAKAQVERVQEGLAAATILPQWQAADVQINDRVQL